MASLKKIFLVIVIISLLGVSTVFASDIIDITDPNSLVGSGSSEQPAPNTVQNTATVQNTTNTANTTNIVAGTNNTSTYNNTTQLPQTGAGDYTTLLVIGIFAVGAIYAYKKIRDYQGI